MNFQTKIYVGNLPENCDLQAFRSLFEKYGQVVECDIVKNYGFVHFVDGEDAKTAVDRLNDKKWDGMTLKVELSYSKVRHKPGMGNRSLCYRCGKCGHWSKDCPKGPSRRGPSWNNNINNNNNNNSSYSEHRNQPLRGNRGFFMNIGETSDSSGSGSFLSRNRYQNNSLRDSYRGFSSSSPSYYYSERNNSVKNTYSANNNYHNNNEYHRDTSDNHNSGSGRVIGLSRISRYDDDDDNEEPSSYDSYPPPPPPPTRYRPYPSAYERRTSLPPLPGNRDNFITPPPQLSSPPPPPSLSRYHHHHQQQQHNNNNSNNHPHHNSSSLPNPSSHNSNVNNIEDAYVRPTAEYYERRRGYHSALGVPRRQDEREK